MNMAGEWFALSGVLAAGLLVSTPGIVQGQTPPKVFFACYVPRTGTVYRIKEPGLPNRCVASSHVEFSWTDGAQAMRNGDAAGGDLAGSYPNPLVARLQGRAVSTRPPQSHEVLTWLPTSAAESAWTPAPVPAGVTDHGALTGLADDDHTHYLLADGVRASLNGFAVTGSAGMGSIPIQGAGTRLMWYPGKSAFRVGDVQGTEWDNANVGSGSIAMGGNSMASGQSSIAIGSLTTARGNKSTAIGSEAEAGGELATALGYLTNAVGVASTAMGALTEASGAISTAIGCGASTNYHLGSFVYGDMSTVGGAPEDCSVVRVDVTADNSFVVRAQNVWFGKNGDQVATAGRYIETSTGAYLSDGGDWTNASDVNRKENFRDEDAASVLQRLARLPIRSWNYRAENANVRHLGPTAQDFHRAFQVGVSDKAISTVDAAGVALLSIQALEQRTRDQAGEIEALRTHVAMLERDNHRFATEVAALQTEIARRLAILDSVLVRK